MLVIDLRATAEDYYGGPFIAGLLSLPLIGMAIMKTISGKKSVGSRLILMNLLADMGVVLYIPLMGFFSQWELYSEDITFHLWLLKGLELYALAAQPFCSILLVIFLGSAKRFEWFKKLGLLFKNWLFILFLLFLPFIPVIMVFAVSDKFLVLRSYFYIAGDDADLQFIIDTFVYPKIILSGIGVAVALFFKMLPAENSNQTSQAIDKKLLFRFCMVFVVGSVFQIVAFQLSKEVENTEAAGFEKLVVCIMAYFNSLVVLWTAAMVEKAKTRNSVKSNVSRKEPKSTVTTKKADVTVHV